MAFLSHVDERVVAIDPFLVHYYDTDPASKGRSTIVLLHGTGGSADNNFRALLPMLATRHRVVALTFEDPEELQSDVAAYVAQTVGVINTISGGEPVHLVGYSFGAVVAAEVAASKGDLVQTLTLVAGWLKTDQHQQLRNDLWQQLYKHDHPGLAAFSVFTGYSQHFINSLQPQELDELVESVRMGPDRSKKMHINRAVDLSGVVGDITAPTLIVGCEQDAMAPIRHSHLLFGGIDNARLARVSSGHAIVHERPSELFVLIDDFVRDPAAVPAGTVLTTTHA